MEIFLPYIIYSVVVGIGLSIFHLIRSKNNIPLRLLGWLTLFPAIGLGKLHYYLQTKEKSTPDYPQKWYVLGSVVRINTWFILLQLLLPLVLVFIVFSFNLSGVMTSGIDWFDGAFAFLFGLGALAILFGFILYSIFWLGIQYLLLVAWPRSEQRKVERALYQKSIQHTTNVNPMTDNRKPIALLPSINTHVSQYITRFQHIPSARKKELAQVADYIKQKHENQTTINLIFICTHNSRRSQFGQIWAAVAAAYYGIKNVHTFSGGTEETAFNKRAVSAIKRVGFKVEGTMGTNPRYSVRFSEEAGALNCFSKTIDNPTNPQKGFAAIITCSDADKRCPIVHGAEYRARIKYEDPKFADRTETEAKVYDQRCEQIATEMLYMFSKV